MIHFWSPKSINARQPESTEITIIKEFIGPAGRTVLKPIKREHSDEQRSVALTDIPISTRRPHIESASRQTNVICRIAYTAKTASDRHNQYQQ